MVWIWNYKDLYGKGWETTSRILLVIFQIVSLSLFILFQMLKFNEHFCGYEDKPCIVFLFKKRNNLYIARHPCDYYSEFCSTLSVLIYLI